MSRIKSTSRNVVAFEIIVFLWMRPFTFVLTCCKITKGVCDFFQYVFKTLFSCRHIPNHIRVHVLVSNHRLKGWLTVTLLSLGC